MLIPFKSLVKKYGTPKGVLHIGASHGQEAKDYLGSGVEKVVWVEAIPTVFEKLIQTISPYDNMIALNACIADADGYEVDFYVSNNEAQSSSILKLGTHKTAHPEVHYTHTIKCITKRVDTLLKENQIDAANYNFLNIDLQGAELLALKSLGKEIDKIDYAYLEVNKEPLYVGCALIEDIDKFMAEKGFKRVELEWCGNFGWGDAFYTR